MRGRVLILLLGLTFGALVQYLGSLWVVDHVGYWTVDVSAMSAPWLATAFLVGRRERDGVRAAAWGAAVTFAGLAGYFAMTLSPMEGVSHIDLIAFMRSQEHVILPAIVTGPIWGWLGYRWRTSHSRLSAGLLIGAFCLEPLARIAYGNPFEDVTVSAVEIAIGVILAAAAVMVGLRNRQW